MSERYRFIWERPENKSALESACKSFQGFVGAEASLGLTWQNLQGLYGAALTSVLGHVFAEGWRRSNRSGCRGNPIDGCWRQLERVMDVHPDWFRSYCYRHEDFMASLRTVFLFGWFGRLCGDIPPAAPCPENGE